MVARYARESAPEFPPKKAHKMAAKLAAKTPHKLDAYEPASIGICRRRRTYDPVGYYFPAGLVCADCVEADAELQYRLGRDAADMYPQIAAVFPDTESDSPEHCEKCEALIGHALTTDGHLFVADALADGTGRSEVLAAWREVYGGGLG